MSGVLHDDYVPKTRAEKWVERRLPLISLLYGTLMIRTPGTSTGCGSGASC
ncbi:hypothetical protein Rumeso_03230 [Rubellimicrobium mesophilum DSM 19309]|uniref:Uncharacterized protein n=1 Tax=Rubellimicrobium mesophilum DSM 19309 TaxID=442562 RepID=A0A017HMY7_9RHOB|nr:hypothetical protein Rumeso_03230 [Rubellimicrobium mesophilum DSM 19309]